MLSSLQTYGGPALVAVLLWWGGTGALLWAAVVAEKRPNTVLAVVTAIAFAGMAVIVMTARVETPAAAYAAFAASIAVWGWHELAFLTGAVTGTRRAPCPEGCGPWTRFWCAAATVVHHEIALLATVVGLFLLLLDAPNQTALLAFAVLWVMRVSAKLNLFLGVPTRADALLPTKLAHLSSYFRRRRLNVVFPVSVTAGSFGVGALWPASGAEPFAIVAGVLVATLLALAVLEHWFMVVDVEDAALWRWMLPKDDPRRAVQPLGSNADDDLGGFAEQWRRAADSMGRAQAAGRDAARRWFDRRRPHDRLSPRGRRAAPSPPRLAQPES